VGNRWRVLLVLTSLVGCGEAESPCELCSPPPPSTLFVTDRGGDAIVRYDGATGAFRDVFVTGATGGLDRPSSLRLGPSGDLYLAGFGRGDVVRYDLMSGANRGVFYWDTSLLEEPVELVFHGEQLVVLGKDTHNLVVLDPTGQVVAAVGSPDLRVAHDVALGDDGLAYVGVDTHPQLGTAIQVWDLAANAMVRQLGTVDQLASATGVALGPEGALYVCDAQRDQVTVFDAVTGAVRDVLVPGESGLLDTPISLDFGPDGALYVLDARGLHRLNPHTGDELSLFVDAHDGHLAGPRSFTFLTEQAITEAIAHRR
jgi:DNA-binding beta-propeller fold protein YncE